MRGVEGRRGGRRFVLAVLLTGLLAFSSGVVLADHSGTPNITVTPYYDLDPSGPVEVVVDGTGFPAEVLIFISQCRVNDGLNNGCDGLLYGTSTAEGTFSLAVTVAYDKGSTFQCEWGPNSSCMIETWANGWQIGPMDDAAIYFFGHGSPPSPTPVVTPTPSSTPVVTPTPTPLVTPTPSQSPPPTPLVTPSPAVTPTSAVTPTPAVTATPVVTPTPTPTPVNGMPQLTLNPQMPQWKLEGGNVCASGSDDLSCVVGWFTDANGPSGSYRATLSWGDGGTNIGTIAFNSALSRYEVSSNHVYERFGSYPVTMTIADSSGSWSVNGTYAIGDESLVGAKMGQGTANLGRAWNVRLACVTDHNPYSNVTDLRATISWGDRAANSTATIKPGTARDQYKADCEGWTYGLFGKHTYSKRGTYKIVITVTSLGGSKTTARATVKVV